MANAFHYFTPGVSVKDLAPGHQFRTATLKQLRLEHLTGLLGATTAIQDVTIEGKSGAMFTPAIFGQPSDVVVYQPSSQTWLDQGSVWIGWETASPPGPAELAKPNRLPGYSVPDEVGQEWTIPIARSPNGRETVPSDFRFDPVTGEPKQVRKRAYDWLWGLSGEIWDFYNTDKQPEDPFWLARCALQILQVNYWVGMYEINALSEMGRAVLDNTRAGTITVCLIDLEVVQQLKDPDSKKN